MSWSFQLCQGPAILKSHLIHTPHSVPGTSRTAGAKALSTTDGASLGGQRKRMAILLALTPTFPTAGTTEACANASHRQIHCTEKPDHSSIFQNQK